MRTLLGKVLIILLCIAVMVNFVRFVVTDGNANGTLGIRQIIEKISSFDVNVDQFYYAVDRTWYALDLNAVAFANFAVYQQNASNVFTRILAVLLAIYTMFEYFSASVVAFGYAIVQWVIAFVGFFKKLLELVAFIST